MRLVEAPPAAGTVVAHVEYVERLLAEAPAPHELFVVTPRMDRPARPPADLEVVQNLASVGSRQVHIPFWLQPGLIPRDPARGTHLKTVTCAPGSSVMSASPPAGPTCSGGTWDVPARSRTYRHRLFAKRRHERAAVRRLRDRVAARLPALQRLADTHEMLMRLRLERLARRVAALATQRRVQLTMQLVLVAALAFALLRLRSAWSDAHVDTRTLDWGVLVGAGVLAAAAVVATAAVWLVILLRLGSRPRARWVAIVLQTELAKYVPGSVWNYAGRAALTRFEGVGVRILTLSITVELGATVAAGAVVAALIGGWWSFAAATAAAAIAAAALPFGVSKRPERTRLAIALRDGSGGHAFVWILAGLSFWTTAHALFGTPFREVGHYTGAFAVAALAGMVAFFAPVGLGVREALIVALLRSRLGTADALVLAAASRGVFTIADVLTAGGGAICLRQASGRRPQARS